MIICKVFLCDPFLLHFQLTPPKIGFDPNSKNYIIIDEMNGYAHSTHTLLVASVICVTVCCLFALHKQGDRVYEFMIAVNFQYSTRLELGRSSFGVRRFVCFILICDA